MRNYYTSQFQRDLIATDNGFIEQSLEDWQVENKFLIVWKPKIVFALGLAYYTDNFNSAPFKGKIHNFIFLCFHMQWGGIRYIGQ